MNNNETLKMNNPNEPATDAVDRTAQEMLTAFEAKDAAKVNSYYAPDAIIATAGRCPRPSWTILRILTSR